MKTDPLEIDALARALHPEELAAAFEDVAELGGIADAAFVGQAAAEVETLERVRDHALPESVAARVKDALSDSMRAILAGVGLGHPTFARVTAELSPASLAS